MEHQRIIELRADRFKRLRAVQINPDRTLVEITGRNAQGKSSVLDAIECALAGKSAHPAEPVRRGSSKAEVVIELDDIIVERKWKKSGATYLEVRGKDGRRMSGPQQVLDTLIGDLSFDPLAFIRMKPRDQVESICKALKIDIDAIRDQRAQAYDERRLVNRDIKSLEGQLDGLPHHPDAGTESVNVDSLLAEQREAAAAIRENNDQRQRLTRLTERAGRLRDELSDARTKLATLERDVEGVETERDRMAGEVAKLVDPPEADIQERIRQSAAHNEMIQQNRRRAEIEGSLDAKRKQADSLTEQVEQADERKVSAVRDAMSRLGVAGLAMDDDQVLLNDLPLAQASQAEQLRVSVALAFSFNPSVRIVLIKEGSILDRDSLAAVAEIARQHDGQVWVERVTDGDKVGIVIEDGMVVGEPSEPTPAAATAVQAGA